MMGQSHLVCSSAAWAAGLAVAHSRGFSLEPGSLVAGTVIMGATAAGSLSPDMDRYGILKPLTGGHRSADGILPTHSLLAIAIVLGLAALLAAQLGMQVPVLVGGAFAGWGTHVLFSDLITKSGVPLFAPFVRVRVRPPVAITTGRFAEGLAVFAWCALCAGLALHANRAELQPLVAFTKEI